MILYHRTSATTAERILSDGFRDGVGTYMTTEEHSGVWLSNVALDINEGAAGDTLLRVELPEQAIADFEWIEDGKPYREWLVPARLMNEKASGLCVVDEDDDGGIDAWISAHGLEAIVDDLIRTCGFDRVQAALDGAPDRFAARQERLLGFAPPTRPGAPHRHDRRFYEALFEAVVEFKRRHALNDKAACYRLASDLAKVAGDDDLLRRLRLDQAAELEGKTLYREFKRAKFLFGEPKHKLKPAKEQSDLRGPPKGQK